jgi:hypothetical protein
MAASVALAQDLDARLKAQDVVTVTLRDGGVYQGEVESASPTALTVKSQSDRRTFDLRTVQAIRRSGDSLKNGVLIGLLTGAGTGTLFGGYVWGMCNNEGGRNCPTLRVTSWLVPILAGTGLGAAIDASHIGTTLVWSNGSSVAFAPLVGPRAVGVGATIRFR